MVPFPGRIAKGEEFNILLR